MNIKPQQGLVFLYRQWLRVLIVMAQVVDHQGSFPKGLGFSSHYDFILSSWH